MFIVNLARACADHSAALDGDSHFIIGCPRYVSVAVAKVNFRKYKIRSARLAG